MLRSCLCVVSMITFVYDDGNDPLKIPCIRCNERMSPLWRRGCCETKTSRISSVTWHWIVTIVSPPLFDWQQASNKIFFFLLFFFQSTWSAQMYLLWKSNVGGKTTLAGRQKMRLLDSDHLPNCVCGRQRSWVFVFWSASRRGSRSQSGPSRSLRVHNLTLQNRCGRTGTHIVLMMVRKCGPTVVAVLCYEEKSTLKRFYRFTDKGCKLMN